MTRFDESRKNVNKVRLWFYLLNHFCYLCLTNNQTMRTWYAYLIKINFKKRDKIKDNFTPKKVSVSPWILDKNGLTDRCGMVWQKMLFFLVNCIFLRNHDNSKRVTERGGRFKTFLFLFLGFCGLFTSLALLMWLTWFDNDYTLLSWNYQYM